MPSARQLLLMRRARDRAIDIAIASLRTVVLVPDPDFRRRVFRCVSHVGLTFGARYVGRMDRVVSVGCKSWSWVVMLCGGCPTRVSKETPAPHTQVIVWVQVCVSEATPAFGGKADIEPTSNVCLFAGYTDSAFARRRCERMEGRE